MQQHPDNNQRTYPFTFRTTMPKQLTCIIIIAILFCVPAHAQDTDAARKAEAERFAAEARFLQNQQDISEAIEKIEVAIALDPENLHYRSVLYYLLRKQLLIYLTEKNAHRILAITDVQVYLNRIDAEGMRKAIQDAWRIEELVDTFRLDRELGYIYNVHMNEPHIRRALTILAEHVQPEFKEEVRAINRRTLERWFTDYRANVKKIIDQETYQSNFSSLTPPYNPGSYQTAADLAPVYAEIIENLLRLSLRYDTSATGDPYANNVQTYDGTYAFAEALRRCSNFLVSARGKTDLDSDTAKVIENIFVMMERDPRRRVQHHAWIARHKPARVANQNPADRVEYFKQVDLYFEQTKTFLTGLPKGMSFFDSEVLYYELEDAIPTKGGAFDEYHKTLHTAVFAKIASIIELADSREEVAVNAINRYIGWVAEATSVEADKTEFLRLKQQFDPLLLRQFELAARFEIPENHIRNLRNRAADAGIGGTPKIAEIIVTPEHLWKSEMHLLPKEEGYEKVPFGMENGGKTIIHNNVLYCEVRKMQTREIYVACIDLNTLEKRYFYSYTSTVDYPLSTLLHVDDANIYLYGLHVIPLDGSEPWRLTMEDGLPSTTIGILGTLGDWCYAVLAADWIIRINLKTRQWEQLSSSRAKEGKTPFIDGRRFVRYTSLVDTKRELILFAVDDGFTGLWIIQKDGAFIQMGNGQHYLHSFFDHGNVLLGTPGYLSTLDLESKKFVRIWQGFMPPSGSCVWNGYLWGAHNLNGQIKWGRKKIQIGTELVADWSVVFEPLDVPDGVTILDDGLHWQPIFCAPTPDGKNLVVAGHHEIILLRFE